jgi:hypothetical protein
VRKASSDEHPPSDRPRLLELSIDAVHRQRYLKVPGDEVEFVPLPE